MLVEGSSIRSTARVVGCAINTVVKLFEDVGEACVDYHAQAVRNVPSTRIQCDEIWSFCYAKRKNVDGAVAAPEEAGDVWTWIALDPDSKLIVSWRVGERDLGSAMEFMHDLKPRLTQRVTLTSDGLPAYPVAVKAVFGDDVDYRQRGDMKEANTSHVERQNLTMRMSMKRFTRRSNAFSKKWENHVLAVAIHAVQYNFCRTHKTLGTTPAVAAGLAEGPRDMGWLIGLADSN